VQRAVLLWSAPGGTLPCYATGQDPGFDEGPKKPNPIPILTSSKKPQVQTIQIF